MKLKTIYIAGPMSGYPGLNYEAFDEAEENLRSLGWRVINPAKLGRAFEKANPQPWNRNALARLQHMELKRLKKCGAIFMLYGFSESYGATLELCEATEHKLKTYYQDDGYPPCPERNIA